MAQTIFDTDFQPDDGVLLYDGSRFHWGGQIPHPLSPEVNIGDIILFFVVCIAFPVAATKNNGR